MSDVRSPSQTATWMDCPIKRLLSQDGWVRRQVERRDLAACLGSAVHAGLEVWNRGGRVEGVREAARQAASAKAGAMRALWERSGREVPEWLGAQADAIGKRAERAIDYYVEHDPIPRDWQIVAVEDPLTEAGNARPDLVVLDGRGVAPVDYKVKLTADAKTLPRFRVEWENSWQLLHNAWGVGQCDEGPCDHYYICLIGIEPKPVVELIDYPIDPEVAAMWLASARRVWAQMAAEDRGEAQPWMAAKHSDEYGECEYKAACFRHKYVESAMAHEYVRQERS